MINEVLVNNLLKSESAYVLFVYSEKNPASVTRSHKAITYEPNN